MIDTKFCKLFETADLGQILVKIDRNDETLGPEVRLFFQPEDLGVCSCALSGWSDDDAGWDKAKIAFAQIDEIRARSLVQEQLTFLAEHSLEGEI